MIIEPSCAWLYTIFTPKIWLPVFPIFISFQESGSWESAWVLALKAQITVRFP